jgi:hypothetical protein
VEERVSAVAATQKRGTSSSLNQARRRTRWLLPDNDHLIADSFDIADRSNIDEDKIENPRKMIATAVLVKPATGSSEPSSGKLLLFDNSGRKIVEVADNVREIHLASASNGELTIVYERNRHLVLAMFDPASLSKRSEQEIDIPQLK